MIECGTADFKFCISDHSISDLPKEACYCNCSVYRARKRTIQDLTIIDLQLWKERSMEMTLTQANKPISGSPRFAMF